MREEGSKQTSARAEFVLPRIDAAGDQEARLDLDRSLSWVVQRHGMKISRLEIKKATSVK